MCLVSNGETAESQLKPSNMVEDGKSTPRPGTAEMEAPRPQSVSFESFEHKSIGDAAIIQLEGQQIKGKDFGYIVGKNILSYGDITALAGDFYADWTKPISDSKNPGDQLKKNADSLFNDTLGFLTAILKVFQIEETTVGLGVSEGKDPYKIYKDNADAWNKAFTKATWGLYLKISSINWDHFGKHAVICYKAGHRVALTLASQANNETDLRYAYAIDAFANHFVTDLFSTGHLRVPRRAMHNDIFPVYTAPDFCSQAMHDEDSATGLVVANKKEERWLAFGDKQLFSAKSLVNKMRAVQCVQAGTDEIWKAFQQRTVPPEDDKFAALQLCPDPDYFANMTTTDNNSAPMFIYDPVSKIFTERVSIQDRGDFHRRMITESWQQVQAQVFGSLAYRPSVDLFNVSTIMQFYLRSHNQLGVNFWGGSSGLGADSPYTWLNDSSNITQLDTTYKIMKLAQASQSKSSVAFMSIDTGSSRRPFVTTYLASIAGIAANTIAKTGSREVIEDPNIFPDASGIEEWHTGYFVDSWNTNPRAAVIRCPSQRVFNLYMPGNIAYNYVAQGNTREPGSFTTITKGYQVGNLYDPSLGLPQQQLIRIGNWTGGKKMTIETIWGFKDSMQPNYQMNSSFWTLDVPGDFDYMRPAVGQFFYQNGMDNVFIVYYDPTEDQFGAYAIDPITTTDGGPKVRGMADLGQLGILEGPRITADSIAANGNAWFLLNIIGAGAAVHNDLVTIVKQPPPAGSPPNTAGTINIVAFPMDPTPGSLFRLPVVSSFDDPFYGDPDISIVPVHFSYPGPRPLTTSAGLLQIMNVGGMVGMRLFAPTLPGQRTFKVWGCIPWMGQPAHSWWKDMPLSENTFFEVGNI